MKTILSALTAALFALLLYGRTAGFEFVNFDDNNYVYNNPHVTEGLTAENIRWAFEIHGPSMWVPLTWLSHQTAVSLFGTEPAPHHLLNALLHAINAFLLVLLIRRWTGQITTALIAGLLFAVHPIHVESVAWVTERKDVLAGCFWLLTLLAYDRYTKTSNWKTYLPVALGSALSVMAKPLAVTLPCVLLLLDFWPGRRPWSWQLIAEKIPLFLIVGFASFMTVLCQLSIGAIGDAEVFPMSGRIANACTSYGTYLIRLLWPHNLAVFYPYPENIHWAPATFSLSLLLAITAWVLIRREKNPWATVGWFWFLGVLFPMIGLVQAGSQAMADRYLYVPAIGLYLIIAQPLSRGRCRWIAAGFLVLLCSFNIHQASVWKNSRTLFAHALNATDGNYLAHNNYGLTFRDEGDFKTARKHFEASLAIRPSYAEARNNLGITLANLGNFPAAIAQLQMAAANGTLNTDARYNLGTALLNAGDPTAAEFHLRQASNQEPKNAGVRYNLGYALMQQQHWEKAVAEFNTTLRLQPGHSGAATNLRYIAQQKTDVWAIYENANQLRSNGRLEAAEAEYRRALKLRPLFPEAHNNLGVTLGLLGDQAGALLHFEKALELAPDYADARTNVERARQFTP